MIAKRNNFYLDYITLDDGAKLDLMAGLAIKTIADSQIIDISYIYWDAFKNQCYLKTNGDNQQTYVVLYEQYQDYTYLVDAAFDAVGRANYIVNNKVN